jgi:hypothetical protein
MRNYLIFLFLAFSENSFAFHRDSSTVEKKYQFYFAWGYNRDWFSKSDLHFSNSNLGHDFTVYDVRAKDRSGFSEIIPLAKEFEFSIPQYNYRFGLFLKNYPTWGIEIGFDHTKYVMRFNQTLRVSGKLYGETIDTTMQINATQFLHLEHTNGANFLMPNIVKKLSIINLKNHQLMVLAKAGFGVVIPKTYVRFLGEELDNKFHIAGFVTGIETSFRYQFYRFFVDIAGKGVFANFSSVLVLPGTKAKHHFWCFQAIGTAGFVIGRKN